MKRIDEVKIRQMIADSDYYTRWIEVMDYYAETGDDEEMEDSKICIKMDACNEKDIDGIMAMLTNYKPTKRNYTKANNVDICSIEIPLYQ